MTYDIKLGRVKAVKDKYSQRILSIDGVHGIGIRVHDYRIVVYVHEISAEIIKDIPFHLDDIPVEIVFQEIPSPTFSGADRLNTSNSFFVTNYIGTLGSIWWSEKYKRMVAVSNSHVFGGTGERGKRNTSPSVYVNGNSGNPSIIPDEVIETWGNSPQISPNGNGVTITKVSSWDESAGDWLPATDIPVNSVVKLQGENFGLTLFNGNKLIVNGVSVPYLAWEWDYIIFGLPSWALGTIEIKVQAEGVPFYVEDRKNSYSKQLLGEVLDFNKLFFEQDGEGNWYAESNGDVGYCSIVDSAIDDIDLTISERASCIPEDTLYNYYKAGQRSYSITGLVQEVKEYMPVVLSGARGTTFSVVTDPSIDLIQDFHTGYLTVRDSVMYQYTAGTRPFPPSSPGASGSTVVIADIDNLLEFYAYYGMTPPTRLLMENSLKDEQGNQIVFSGNFIGNNYAGEDAMYAGLSDKGTNWMSRMELLPLSMVTVIDTGEVSLASTSGITACAKLVTPNSNLQASVSLTSASTIMDSAVLKTLTPLLTSVSLANGSTLSVAAYIKEPVVPLYLDFDLILVTIVDTNAIDFDLQLINGTIEPLQTSVSMAGSSGITASVLLVNTNLSLQTNASLAGASSLYVTATVVGETPILQASAILVSASSLNVRARIPSMENLQYEHIYFEITRSHDINTEITRTLDLNLAV